MTQLISAAEESRLGSLDRVLDAQEPSPTLAGELFSIVDTVVGQPALGRSFTDPGMPADQRKSVVQRLLTGKVSRAAEQVTAEAAALRWAGPRSLGAALERQGVRANLRAALATGQLADVEEELFRFSRTVAGDRELASALRDRSVPLERRADLVAGLLVGRAKAPTIELATRAVGARGRTYADTVEGYLQLAAELRNRGVATVRVAQPLSTEQRTRLQAVLSRQVGRAIDLHVVVDPEVLGGVQVELGDEVIEGTVAARLTDARRKIQ